MVTKGAPNGRWGHVNERSKQLLLNEFFDMRSRFIRKGCDSEKKREKNEINCNADLSFLNCVFYFDSCFRFFKVKNAQL